MAYVLGFFYADGNMEDASYLRGKYIRFNSTDKNLIFKIRKWLKSKHTIVQLKPIWSNGRKRYLLRIGSHKLYDSLTEKGLYPNKSLTIRFPAIPKQYLKDFTRGYFDGDGCVFLELSSGKSRKKIVKKLSIIFTSGSYDFLKKMNSELKKSIELTKDSVYKSNRSFQLRYSTADTLKLFKFMYDDFEQDTCLPRKVRVFLQYLALRPEKVDQTIRKIIYKFKNGHVAK